MADAAVWITGTGPDKQLNFSLPTGGKGDKGDRGSDDSNVLPTDTAIAINTPASATRTALGTVTAGKGFVLAPWSGRSLKPPRQQRSH